jgi:anti-anti-sigma factor
VTLQVDINHREVDELWEVSLIGSLNTETAPQLEKELESVLDSESKQIIFNMKELDYVSSAGLRIIAKTCREMKNKGGDILMTAMQPQIKRVFEIVKELPNLRMFKNQEEVDEYLNAVQELVKSKT